MPSFAWKILSNSVNQFAEFQGSLHQNHLNSTAYRGLSCVSKVSFILFRNESRGILRTGTRNLAELFTENCGPQWPLTSKTRKSLGILMWSGKSRGKMGKKVKESMNNSLLMHFYASLVAYMIIALFVLRVRFHNKYILGIFWLYGVYFLVTLHKCIGYVCICIICN